MKNEIMLNRRFERLEDYIGGKSSISFDRLHVFFIKGAYLIIGRIPLSVMLFLGEAVMLARERVAFLPMIGKNGKAKGEERKRCYL